MIDDKRAARWAYDAGVALTQHYGKDDAAAHLATIVLALLADRRERELYVERISGPATPAEVPSDEF